MSYDEWKAYWKTLDWSRKWFAIFLIVRPLVDTMYFLKQYSALLSPVYIFGILTPLLAVASIQSVHFKRAPHSGTANLMKVWGAILFINAIYLLSWAYTFNLLGDEIKYLTPPVVFLYLRRYIRHKDDLRFLMTNFLISDAQAQAAGAAPPGGGLGQIVILVIFVVVFYFLLIRPQQKRAKEHAAAIAAVKRGDTVVLSSEIGRVHV